MKTHPWNFFPLAITSATLALGLSFKQAVQAASWTTNAPLITARSQHTATLFSNGKMLVAGGATNGSAELYDTATGISAATGTMKVARYGHTATLLPNGKALAAGGYTHYSTNFEDWYWLDTAELYDPVANTWTFTGSLHTRRNMHTMTLLPNGKVLVAGGIAAVGGTISSAELYDPDSGTWSTTGSMNAARACHTATLLPDGKVLVAGGSIGTVPPPFADLSSAELYDPDSGTWSTTGSMNAARAGHTATLLPDGKVLVAGGDSSYHAFSSAELYDPDSGIWTTTNSLNVARSGHTATLLSCGKVLIAGGYGTNCLASTELYDPTNGTWTTSAAMNVARVGDVATLLTNGDLLVTGGYMPVTGGYTIDEATNSTEVFDYLSVPVPTTTTLTEATKLDSGLFRFTFTNTPGASFGVLTTTNAALPMSDWTLLGGVLEVVAGQFQFTDPQATNHPQRFYRLRSL